MQQTHGNQRDVELEEIYQTITLDQQFIQIYQTIIESQPIIQTMTGVQGKQPQNVALVD